MHSVPHYSFLDTTVSLFSLVGKIFLNSRLKDFFHYISLLPSVNILTTADWFRNIVIEFCPFV